MTATLQVAETFESIQGESTYAGCTCFFIRLAGCNLACAYCDTPAARERGGGKEVEIDALADAAAQSRAAIIEITGGEPLLQPGFPELARRLRDLGPRPVLVETNGTRDLSLVPEHVTAVMDIKCPGSGCDAATDWDNVARLRPCDEVKFVIRDEADYVWARATLERCELATRCRAVLFSPAYDELAPSSLAAWVVRDGLPVRVQVQLHKLLGMR
jgi:7-carboxy-7-deazaguanine synthase